jgi:maltose O-acetyltransferase
MSHYFTWKFIFQRPRVWKFKLLSDNKRVQGKPIYNQPALLLGKGEIIFGKNVHMGFYPSPFFFSGYIHLESRSPNARIVIGDDVFLNNNFFAVSDGEGIEIGNKCLIGANCEIMDSDFHELRPDKRTGGTPATGKVILGENVFLGNNVKITKGVVLGKNVVVANSSVVTNSFPDNSIIGGIPAKIIGSL